MPSHCSDSCMRVDCGILEIMRALDSCGGCVDGYLVGRENSNPVFTLFKTVGFSLEVASIIFTLGRSYGYYVAYKPITLSCILFMFIEMKFIHCHSCVMFAMKSMSRCND